MLFRLYVGGITSIKGLQPVSIPLLCDIPCLGTILFRHNWLVYLVYILVPFAWFVLYRTTWGLKVRAVGTKPEAADTLGESVDKIRYQCLILGGAMAGLAGAFLTIGQANMFVDNITAGRGFIAIALVYFGRWNPWGIMAGSLLFSMADSFQSMVQVLGIKFPYELAVMSALPGDHRRARGLLWSGMGAGSTGQGLRAGFEGLKGRGEPIKNEE